MHPFDSVASSGAPCLADAITGMWLADLIVREMDHEREAARQREPRLLALLARRGPAWRFARQLTGNDRDADDVLQDAAIKALANAERFTDRPSSAADPLKSWLFLIVKRANLDRLRRIASEPERGEPDADTYRTDDDDSADPLDGRDLSRVMFAALSALPADQRKLLEQVAADRTCASIAAAEGAQPGTVRQRYARALQSLGEAMQKVLPDCQFGDFDLPQQTVTTFLREHRPQARKPAAHGSADD